MTTDPATKPNLASRLHDLVFWKTGLRRQVRTSEEGLRRRVRSWWGELDRERDRNHALRRRIEKLHGRLRLQDSRQQANLDKLRSELDQAREGLAWLRIRLGEILEDEDTKPLPPHTCTLINKAQEQIEDAQTNARTAARASELDDAKSSADDVLRDLDEIDLEPIRKANSQLRDAAENAQCLIQDIKELLA